MTDIEQSLRSAFADAGYEVGEIRQNRKQVSVVVTEDDASASALREIVVDTLGDDSVLGLDVTTESTGDDEITTVVSFRHRE
ncbi:hypothetical protein [Halovenus marina]|uniref:hypothetical protein n=1 Tax=Halovenus marina TaxID=3396621 RepID=UPI003F57679B